MQSRFTPGKWLRDGRTVYVLDATDNSNRFSATVQGGWEHWSPIPNEGIRTTEAELEAVATLMQAAPDLYEALKEAESVISKMHDQTVAKESATRHWLAPKLQRMRAVIAKAEGRPLLPTEDTQG